MMLAKLQIKSHLADSPSPVITDYLTDLIDFPNFGMMMMKKKIKGGLVGK